MATAGSISIGVKLDYMPVLEQLGIPEIVAKMRYDEWARGSREAGDLRPGWPDATNQAAWISTAREKLAEALDGRQ